MTGRERVARAPVALLVGAALACTSHRVHVEPIEVKPIHLTVDVNVRVQRELDEFFDFEEEVDPAMDEGDLAVEPPGEQP